MRVIRKGDIPLRMNNSNNPEVLAPVGSEAMCYEAIHHGADAVYIGMPGFNARGRSHDHDLEQLGQMIDTCHLYGVKVYLAFNILIFQSEWKGVAQLFRKVVQLGPDALIVQDLGLVRWIRQVAPNIPIHASTQMTVTNHEAITLLDDLAIKRFVLGRENTLDDIKLIKQNTNKELEVFVHGALCVAYSGQCFTSEAIGGRSANRGQCAQSCRFDYQLWVDGNLHKSIDRKYLVSPQDLCGLEHVDKLKAVGVDSLKIEGRLKGPTYVASAVRAYKSEILQTPWEKAQEKMQTVFSRGFYSGWLDGVAHQKLVDGTFSDHRGLFIGDVINHDGKGYVIRYQNPSLAIQAGDGVVLVKDDQKIGAKVFSANTVTNHLQKVSLHNQKTEGKWHGAQIYLNHKESVQAELKMRKKLGVSLDLKFEQDKALLSIKCQHTNLNMHLPWNIEIDGKKYSPSPAVKSPSQSEDFIKHWRGLSHTAYDLQEFNLHNTHYFVPNKWIKNAKQLWIAHLNEVRVKKIEYTIKAEPTFAPMQNSPATNSKLNLLVRNYTQLECLDAIEDLSRLDMVILDYEFGKDYLPSLDKIHSYGLKSAIATNRILKPGEYHHLKQLERACPHAFLIRNLGALHYFQNKGFTLLGDFSLNCSNSLTLDYLVDKGVRTQCASFDLNAHELIELAKFGDATKLEVVLSHYMPEFHMEHCVFAAFLSKGNSFRDCGKPCEKHQVRLKDMYGNWHELKADQECRNTMFRAENQTALRLLPELQNLGVSSYRLEALYESAQTLAQKVNLHLYGLANVKQVSNILLQLEKLESFGLVQGQLFNPKNYQDRKQKV